MSYGGKKWARQPSRARRAGKRRGSNTKTGRKSTSSSARRATKSAKRKSSTKRRTSRSTATRKRTRSRKKATRTLTFYSTATGKRVSVAKRDYADALADPELTQQKPKMVYRYNPETGRKVRVPETSVEAQEWSSRKPSKGFAGELQRGLQLGGKAGTTLVATKVAERAIRTSSRQINKAVKELGKKAVKAAAGVGLTGTTAAAALAAGLIAYGLTKEAVYPQATVALRLDAALKNYLAVRRAMAKQLGRELTSIELRTLYNKYLETVVRIKSHDPTVYLRPGAE